MLTASEHLKIMMKYMQKMLQGPKILGEMNIGILTNQENGFIENLEIMKKAW